MRTKLTMAAMATILMLSVHPVFSQSALFPNWAVLSEDGSKIGPKDTVYMDMKCAKLDGRGVAAIWDRLASYRDFRLDLDMAGSVMAGIGFHVADEQNYQFLYFRPGYGGTREAIQYIPVYNGALSWVMYSDYQNTADIKQGQWFHAAIEVRGESLKVFVNHSQSPQMDIRLLSSKSGAGGIMLRTMFGAAYFANVKLSRLPTQLSDWEISGQFPKDSHLGYADLKDVKKWTAVSEKGDDYLNFCRYFEHPSGTVLAKRTVSSETDRKARMDFDFAGKLRIFLNGREIYHYEKANLETLRPDGNHIILDLLKGDNELCLISEGDADIFGKGYNSLGRLQHQNWGFTGKIGN